MLLPIIISRP